MEDGFSRFISLAPVKSKTAEEVIQALLDQYISRFGCPLVIHSDNRGSSPTRFKKLLARLEVANTTTPAYNPVGVLSDVDSLKESGAGIQLQGE